MLTEKIKELAAAKAKVNELEQKIAAERVSELAALPASFGFESVAAFVKAVRAAAGRKPAKRRKARKARKAAGKPKKQAKKKKTRTRAKITDVTRADVKKMVEAKKTGAEIAKALGISLPSVQNIKKALGLVKARA
jgi:hypothetical protein